MRNKLGLVVLGIALGGLSGCSHVPDAVNPISWYRDVTGASKNDNLGSGENEKNLEEGGNEPYPNLGTVPNPPDTQLSGVDREKLVDSLIADRQHAEYSAESLHAGEVASTVPPPPPPAAAKPSDSNGAASPGEAAPASPAQGPASPPLPPASVGSSAPSTPTPSATAPLAAAPAAAASAVTPSGPAAAGTKTANAAGNSRRLPPRGSEAPPAESSLQSPTIPNLPQGEAAAPAPPLPYIPPPNATAEASPPPPPAEAVPAKPVLPPRLTPPAAPRQQATAPATVPATAPARSPAISYRVADVNFARGSALLSDGSRNAIAEIVKLHNDEGGTIRVIGHGEALGQDAAMAGFTLALNRAQAVAMALTDAGVPAKDIAVETAPVAAKGGTDAPRAEVYLER